MPEAPDSAQVDLRRFVEVLRRRRALIAIVVLVLVTATTTLSLLQPEVYEAEAKVLVAPRGTGLLSSDSQLRLDPAVVVETEVEVLRSDPVVAAVEEQLGPVDTAAAERVGETLMIAVRAKSTDARRAAEVADAYARSYMDLRMQQALDERESAGRPMQERIAGLQQEIDALDIAIEEAPPDSRDALVRSRDVLLVEQARYTERLEELEITASADSGGVQLVSPAQVPESPVSPKPVRNALLAMVGGLLLGIGLASVLEVLDESVKTRDELRAATDGLPVLGAIPRFDGANGPPLLEDGTVVGEAYRMLRTSIQLLGVDRPIRTVLVTSPASGEGKTTTVANLAMVLTSVGQRVVVVDCDLRRPKLHEAFGRSNRTGFTSLLLDDGAHDDALQPVSEDGRLVLVASGLSSPNPSELLASKRAAKVFFDLQSRFDMVLIDCPPVLAVTDATLLAAWVDATVLVAAAGVTSRKQLRSAIEVLRQVDAPLKGTVLNRATIDRAPAYPYGPDRGEADRRPPAPLIPVPRSPRPAPAPGPGARTTSRLRREG